MLSVRRETVDAVIQRVMAVHPSPLTMKAELAYYEAVHQELAPLARDLEQENAELRRQLQAMWRVREADSQRGLPVSS